MLSLGLTLVILLVVGLIITPWNLRKQTTERIKNSLKGIQQQFSGELVNDAELLSALIDSLQGNQSLQRAWLDRDREKLLQLATPSFQSYKSKHRVTHFYFHDLDRINFLRIHNPARYGDYIDRFTLDAAVNTNNPSFGIELGPFGTFTLRVVHPWYINNSLAGYIELGEEIEHITPQLSFTHDVELFFLIEKEFLNRTGWEEGLRMMGRQGKWDEYANFVIIDKTLDTPPSNIAKALKQHADIGHVFILFEASLDTHQYQGGFIPLFDASNKELGEILVLYDITSTEENIRRSTLIQLCIFTFLGAGIFFLFWLYVGHLEQKLVKSRKSLHDEISKHKKTSQSLLIAKGEAERANKAKSEFLANMSHEIRTPMNAILGFSELLMNMEMPSEQKDYLKFINSSGNRLLDLINDVLDFSKIEAKKFELEMSNFNLYRLVSECAKTLAIKAHEKDLEVIVKIHPDLPGNLNLFGDPGRLRQILVNLIGNAVKFTKKGEIAIFVQPGEISSDRKIELQFLVTDTGIGIPSEKRDTIFKAFSQADGSVTREYGGTGLGLTISAHLVKLMGGDIRVESEPGKGSTFSFNASFGVADSKKCLLDMAPHSRLSHLSVLIVDDNFSNLQVLSEMISDHVAEVELAKSGDAALLKLQNRQFDLMLIDVQMPGMDGFSLVKEIKKNPVHTSTPIIILTSSGQHGETSLSKELGIDGYLMKPVANQELLAAIQAVINTDKKIDKEIQLVTRNSLAEIKYRILLAEDEPINQALAVAILEDNNCQVTIANNGKEALEIQKENEFDLILMDIQMPVLDGIEATKAIREAEKGTGKHIPIIAQTAHAIKGDKERIIEAGVDDYITKPFKANELFETIQKIIHSKRTQGNMPLKRRNCWEAKKCGREPGGSNTEELGICPAAISSIIDGCNKGKFGSRICWAIAGTLCGKEIQGTFAKKLRNCNDCEFMKEVQEEEGRFFVLNPDTSKNK